MNRKIKKNNKPKHVLIIGGGFSGFSCAIKLLQSGFKVTILEKENRLGGLAFSFIHKNKHFHTGYHQILASDKPLLQLLKELNLYEKVHWKKCKTNILLDKKIYNMLNPIDFLQLPLSPIAKIRFAYFMALCYAKKKWDDLEDTSAAEWIEKNAGKEILETMFAPLFDIKFGLDAKQISAAWVGARLGSREASCPFGCILGDEWTHLVCEAAEKKIIELGGIIKYNEVVQNILVENNTTKGVKTQTSQYYADCVVSTVAPPILKRIVDLNDATIDNIEYIDSISTIVSVKKTNQNFYWLMCMRPRKFIGGLFNLTDLNPTLGNNNEIILNFFTNVSHGDKILHKSDEEFLKTYQEEYFSMYKEKLKPNWFKVNRIPFVSAKYTKGYKNPSVKTKIGGLYLAGNFMSYPSVTSTGTAIQTGWDAAKIILKIRN